MSQKEMEIYLAELEKALQSISVGERAEIITEIKSHLMEAQEREPERALKDIMASLGDPHQVANRYLLERGIQPTPTPARYNQVAKWLVIGILGFFGTACITGLILVFSFTPLIDVDEKNGRVELLGGTIKINKNLMEDISAGFSGVKLGGIVLNGRKVKDINFNGSRDMGTKSLNILFTNGKFTLRTAEGNRLLYNCKVSGDGNQPRFQEKTGQVLLDLGETRGSKCQLDIPKGTRVHIDGQNGKMELEKPRFHTEVKLLNGKVDIEPESGADYKYTTELTNGVLDEFESSSSPKAWEIKVAVINGAIKKE